MEEEDHFELTTRLGSAHRKRWVCVTVLLGSCLGVTLLTVVALGTVIGLWSTVHPSSTVNDDVCLTPACIDLSTVVRQNMNEDIDPCEDFYNFSCGGWEKVTVVPPNTGSIQMANQLLQRNYVAMKKVLESGQDDGVEAVRKAIDAYRSCMDTSAIDEAGLHPLLHLISSTGGWSLLDGRDSGWHLNGPTFVKEKLFSSDAFFVMLVDIDPLNSTRYVIQLQQAGLSLNDPTNYLPDSPLLSELNEMIVSFIMSLDPTLNKTVANETAASIVDLEIKLANITQDISDYSANITKYYNIRELRNVSYLWPDLNWLNFTNRLFGTVNIKVDLSEPVFVVTPTYFSRLSDVLKGLTNRTLENYAKWHLIRSYFNFVSQPSSPSETWDLLTSPSRSRGHSPGVESQALATDRYKTCIEFVQSTLPMALGRLFAAHILPSNTKGNVTLMIDYVKNGFKERLSNNTWMDDPTKVKCREKVDAASSFISYPDWLFDDNHLNGLYSELIINSTDYFGNFNRSSYLSFLVVLSNLHQPISRERVMWMNPPTQLNAFYNPPVNSLIIMEGISRPPWFDPRWPDYFKFGALGAVAAHELTHGFDNNGRHYDKNGLYRDWWSEKSVAEFEKRQQCFVDQYSHYELYGYKVNGTNSLPDNIADNGGMKVSFQAYKDFVKNNSKTVNVKPLPALTKYTPEQMYYIAWAQLWCSAFTKDGFKNEAQGDHSPGPFRVVGTVVNSPEFADTFHCPAGSKMNPDNKCLMW